MSLANIELIKQLETDATTAFEALALDLTEGKSIATATIRQVVIEAGRSYRELRDRLSVNWRQFRVIDQLQQALQRQHQAMLQRNTLSELYEDIAEYVALGNQDARVAAAREEVKQIINDDATATKELDKARNEALRAISSALFDGLILQRESITTKIRKMFTELETSFPHVAQKVVKLDGLKADLAELEAHDLEDSRQADRLRDEIAKLEPEVAAMQQLREQHAQQRLEIITMIGDISSIDAQLVDWRSFAAK